MIAQGHELLCKEIENRNKRHGAAFPRGTQLNLCHGPKRSLVPHSQMLDRSRGGTGYTQRVLVDGMFEPAPDNRRPSLKVHHQRHRSGKTRDELLLGIILDDGPAPVPDYDFSRGIGFLYPPLDQPDNLSNYLSRLSLPAPGTRSVTRQ